MAALLQNQSTSDQVKQCRRLAQVLTLTRQMLVHAERGEWEQVAEQEVARREDLTACFSDSVPAADTELMAQAMAALLHLNEELMSKLKLARDKVMEQGREFTHNRNAVGSYRAVGTVL